MKLSEAIRLGAMATPQAWFALIEPDGATCALGAALFAVGKCHYRMSEPNLVLHDEFPILATPVLDPVWAATDTLQHTIECLNDDSEWTREQIADFVETIEANFATTEVRDELRLSLTVVGATGLAVSSPKK